MYWQRCNLFPALWQCIATGSVAVAPSARCLLAAAATDDAVAAAVSYSSVQISHALVSCTQIATILSHIQRDLWIAV